LEDILPLKKRKPNEEDAINYVVDRTLMRPRDLIDFINRCFSDSGEITRLTWADLRSAEVGYSEARLQAIVDEWANCYFALPATFPLLSKLGPRFTPDTITDEDLLSILVDQSTSRCNWLQHLTHLYSNGGGFSEVKREVLIAWFTAGLVGIKDAVSHRLTSSLDRAFIATKDADPKCTYVVLNMVRSALGINGPRSVL
jgi:hypothetical protein